MSYEQAREVTGWVAGIKGWTRREVETFTPRGDVVEVEAYNGLLFSLSKAEARLRWRANTAAGFKRVLRK